MNQLYLSIRPLLLGLALITVGAAGAQIDTPVTPPEHDIDNLYARAAASKVVVVGTVTRRDGIPKRLTKELESKVKAEGRLNLLVGGSLYAIEVESTVCHQGDFQPNSPAPLEIPKTIYIFLPRDEPAIIEGHQKETLLPGQQYLFFLVDPDTDLLHQWIRTYDLDQHLSYFRGEEYSRGIVPLKPGSREVLEKITSLCEAVRPLEVSKKLSALKKLQRSDDPVLYKEAHEAEENLLRAKPSH